MRSFDAALVAAAAAEHPDGIVWSELWPVLGPVGESRLRRAVDAAEDAGLVRTTIERRLARDNYRRPQRVVYPA